MSTDQETNLWKAYASQLKSIFNVSGALADDEAIFIPPFNSLGPPVGTSKHAANTNSQIFKLGDMLLPVHKPFFTPGPSYSQRLWRYLNAVRVSGNQNSEALKQLQDRNRDLAQSGDDFLDSRRRALKAYSEDPDILVYSFDEWVERYSPEYLSDLHQLDAAREAADQASQDYYGYSIDQLKKDKDRVRKALLLDHSLPKYNMPVSSTHAPADEPEQSLKALTYRPIYGLNGDYRVMSQDWKATVRQHQGNNFELKFSASDVNSKGAQWGDIGHQDTDWKADPLLATLRPNEKPGQMVNVPKNKGSVTVSITATDAQIFQISAGAWDLDDVAKTYPVLRADALKTDLMEPMVQVSQVLLGYNVAVKLSFSSRANFDTINDAMKTAESEQSHYRLFGVEIGKRADAIDSANKIVEEAAIVPFTEVGADAINCTITLPTRDSAYSRLLAVKGRRLNTPQLPLS